MLYCGLSERVLMKQQIHYSIYPFCKIQLRELCKEWNSLILPCVHPVMMSLKDIPILSLFPGADSSVFKIA